MEEYAGRILANRYRLPLPPSDAYELVETRAFDTRSGQEVLVRQVPLPEVVDAELMDGPRAAPAAARRSPADLPAVRRAIEAAQAAASIPDHPRLDQVFDVFAEGESLWIVSELVPARPLAALIADEPLSPYRAAEVASDVLTALRVLHAHGWTHRNITVRTVLVCEDGRVVLTGLAAGAAEEALCGYDPVPSAADFGAEAGWGSTPAAPLTPTPAPSGGVSSGGVLDTGSRSQELVAGYEFGRGPESGDPGPGPGSGTAPSPPAVEYAPLVAPGYDTGPRYTDHITPGRPEDRPEDRPELQAAARAGAIAAYRAGARAAAARVTEQRKAEAGAGAGPVPERRPEGSTLPQGYSYPYGGPETGTAAPWHGATPRRPALPAAPAPQESAPQESVGQPSAEPQPDGQSAPWQQGESQPQAEPQPDGQRAPWQQGEPAARAVLPAQLALPQGYRQAEAPDPAVAPAALPGPGQGLGPGPAGPQPGQGLGPGPAGPQPGQGLGPGPAGPQPGQGLGPGPVPVQPDRSHPAPPQPPRLGPGPAGSQPGHGPVPVQPDRSHPAPPQPNGTRGASAAGGWTGPRTGLDAERARQTRMAVVGAVTERWAPEQAGPVHGHWQLAPPVGPSTDLWALGALLYRAVQGHAPYPEDSVAELVEMVCAEPPAFAEECGALRPIVESLLRQDPTERPDFEELRGWLRSLVRSAPEPDAGFGMLPMAEADPARLPVVRRRGEIHGRHRNPSAPRKPRALGRTLLIGILTLLAGAVAYAMLFMPRAATSEEPGDGRGSTAQAPAKPSPSQVPTGTPESKPAPQTTAPAGSQAAPAPAPPGYTTQQDPEHFEIVVPDGWERRGINEAGQVRYTDGQFVLTVVPGRDKVEGNPDPAGYQKDKEPELTPYRTSTWSTVGDVKTTKVGQQLRATGRYTWIDGTGRNVYARNFVVALGGSYHVVMVTGPEDEQSKVTEVFEKATTSYKSGG
ncbi:protein kinase [Streptomyces sp. NBC_01294]|uniref:protein kinase n=1 Tax=Streptomyces sp. NBC_01294 TaxID=2903815 RepID=UPI002DDA3ADB|nr:protein kinase [Streptomyces sp. NBC_01294]WRZ57557.1 protein kinase [Streptomyces sp. NBC_01294]